MSTGDSNKHCVSKYDFDRLSDALKHAGVAQPVLVIDKARLDHNIACLKYTLDEGFDYRIVAKSLPSVPMLSYIMSKTNTNRLMCFHLPFLKHLVLSIPEVDILLGKPMTSQGMEAFYHWFSEQSAARTHSFDPTRQLQWLVDSDQRLAEYERVARQLGIVLNVSLEVDVGLHRGGYADEAEFSQSLKRFKASESIRLSGLMGYEAHITKIPAFLGGPQKAEREAKRQYEQFVALIGKEFGHDYVDSLCLNMGGSTTYPLYTPNDACTELATASALVKPSDFDVYTLDDHEPAVFIATPILKLINKPALPMANLISSVMRKVGLLPEKACFIYGGNWLAKPCFPEGTKRVEPFGFSSNQEMYGLLHDVKVSEDDFMFFRPTQSEAVLLQFGDILLYDKTKPVDEQLSERWPVFSYPKSDSSREPGSAQKIKRTIRKVI